MVLAWHGGASLLLVAVGWLLGWPLLQPAPRHP
jgi:hypothetical protein